MDTGDGIIAGLGIIWLLFSLAIVVLVLIAMWRIYEKAGKPGWAAIIPIYNIIVLLQIVGRPAWWVILYFIPVVNLVISIIVTHELSKSFGKDVAFTIGLILLGVIFYPILGFGDAQYVGPAGVTTNGGTGEDLV